MPHPVAQREVEQETTPRGSLTHIGNWTLGRTLGRGAYAHVRLATHVSGRKAACKILPALYQDPTKAVTWDQTVDAVEAHKEVVLLKALSGLGFSGVVELEGVIERDGWTYMFSTLHSGSADELELPWDHDLLINFFRRLCITVHALHQLQVSHEDIKTSNVLVDRLRLPALIDFGFSHFSPYGDKVRSAGGTLDYSSPEKVQDEMYYGPANDVWSLGILLSKLIGIPHPFISMETDSAKTAKAKIAKAQPEYHFRPEHMGQGRAASLIMQMLERKPRRRITLPQVLDHPFLLPTRPDPYPFRPPSCTLPPKLQGTLPFVVIQDLCFLAYLNKEFFLCETPLRIEERVYGEKSCWEKRWAKMLNRWKEREEMDWEDLPFPMKPMTKPRLPPAPRRSVLKEIHLEPRLNMGPVPTKSNEPPNGKAKHLNERDASDLAGINTQGGQQGSPPKRARTGQNHVIDTDDPVRGRLPVLDERDHRRLNAPRITLRVKPTSRRNHRATQQDHSPGQHRTAQLRPRNTHDILSSSSSSVHYPILEPARKDLLGSEDLSPAKNRDTTQPAHIGPIKGMRGLALAVPESITYERPRRSTRIAAKDGGMKTYR